MQYVSILAALILFSLNYLINIIKQNLTSLVIKSIIIYKVAKNNSAENIYIEQISILLEILIISYYF